MGIAYDQDVQLRISTRTDGASEVTDLADKIAGLGKEAGSAQPQFVELANALRKMGADQSAINTFRDAKVESQHLRTELTAAASAVDRLAAELIQAKTATQQSTQAQQEASQRLVDARTKRDELRVALAAERTELKSLTAQSREAGAEKEAFTQQIAASRSAIDTYRQSLTAARADVKTYAGENKEASTALKESAAAERQLATEYDRSVSAAGKLSAAVAENTTHLDKSRAALTAAGIDTIKLQEAQRRLSAEMQQGKQAAAALAERYKATGAAAASAGANLDEAFAITGIRSADAIQTEITKINQALSRLAISSNVSGEEFDRAFAAAQEQIANLNAELSDLPVAQTTIGINGLGGSFSHLGSILGGLGIATVGQKFLEANLAADKLQKSLQAVNGDAGKTASDLEFLKETAARLGINLESSSSAFVKLSAAAKGTSLEGKATRDIFSSVGGAMSQLGLSSAETERAFAAIAQMMSKGTVSAEELKGQLGDVLPGALSIAARATNLTTQELGKLMESGGLLAEDFLPKFAAEAQKSFGSASGDIQGLSNTIERVKNTWSELLAVIGQGGGLTLLLAPLGVVNTALVVFASALGTVINGVVGLAQSIGVVVAAFATWDFSHLSAGLADIGEKMGVTNERLASISNRALGLPDNLNKVGNAAKQAGAAAEQSGVGWEKIIVAYDQTAKSMADYVEQAKKTAKATDEQASVLVKLAQLSGDENALLRAKEEASIKAADGADKIAEALDREAKALQAKVIALQEEIKGQKNVSEAKLKAIEEAQKAAEAKTEEARAALGLADAARVEAAAAEAVAIATFDHSKQVDELKHALEEAAIKVDVLRVAQLAGVDVSKQLKDAEIEAAKAKNLYKDAIKDQIDKIEALKKAKLGDIDVDRAGINLAIARLKASYDVAKAQGNEAGASKALSEIKRLEIELAKLTTQAKKAEAEAAVLVAKAKIEELRTNGQMTAAKEAEIKALEAGVKVKQIEAEIAEVTSKKLADLEFATRGVGNASEDAAGHNDKLANSLGGVGDAAKKAKKDLQDLNATPNRRDSTRPPGDSEPSDKPLTYEQMVNKGMSQSEIQNVLSDRNTNDVEKSAGVVKRNVATDTIDWRTEALRRGATSAQATEVANLIGDKITLEMDRVRQSYQGASSADPYSYRLAINGAYEAALTKAMQEATGAKANLGASAASAPKATQHSTVTINLNGRSKDINLSSADDASALTDLLKQLESEAARAL